MKNKGFEFYRNAMEEGTILTDMVMITQHSKELGEDILLMDFDGIKGVVKREDVDNQVAWKSLVGFVGRKIHFVVTGVDEETSTVFCSRKIAQEKMTPEVTERINSGNPVMGVVSGVVNYGAYIDIDGVYALLKNSDFSDDHVPVGDIHNTGDSILVRLKRVSDTEKIAVEAVNKYVLESVLKFDSFEKDQVVLGKVNGVKPWGAYVTIAPGLDALCPIPETGEIEEGTKVSFRITQVREDEKRIRGKILRIIQ